MKIVRYQPAKRWGEAFPIGNGHMGAMVYADVPNGKIDLSENTFFSGDKSNNNQINASQAFQKMREYAIEGRYDEVHEEAKAFIGIRKNYGTNLPVGSLYIRYDFPLEEVMEYERSLDIMNGVAFSTFLKGKHRIREELFISHPDHILTDHIQLDGMSSIVITFAPGNEYGTIQYENNSFSFACYAYEKMHCDELSGVCLSGFGTVITDGITVASEKGIAVHGAKDIKIFLGMATDFKRDFLTKEEALQKLGKEVKKHVNKCISKDFDKLRKQHRQDILRYMERVELHLEGKDELSKQIPLLYQYGRYLLLSSSREDSLLPAHLQGIWNDNVACRIGWTCDMHLDINTQMNYWPAEAANLIECAEPLYRWIHEDLSTAGTQTAKEAYGLEGWVGELVSNAWGFAAPYWATPIAPCPTGGVWILMQMWEHYQYSEDLTYLRERAFPLIEEAARFFDQYVFEDASTGYYTCGPSISPENSFIYQNHSYQISNGCTYEILMIRELFIVYLKACEKLNQRTSILYSEVTDKLKKLLPYRVTREGTIAEWSHDLPQADVQHRHTSHLLGLYPFSQINWEETPELCEAAEKTIQTKLTPIENWEDTGWARSMLILYEARLRDGNAAYGHIKSMLTNLLEPNRMVYHPPTRGAGAFDHVYELDGNTGLTTGIMEMLLHSHNGILHLLPALPEEWKSGEIKGLRARGDITVDISWKCGKLISAKLMAAKNTSCTVLYMGYSREISLEKEISYHLISEVNKE